MSQVPTWSTRLKDYEEQWAITEAEKVQLKEIWNTKHQIRKQHKSKNSMKNTFHVLEAHSSRLTLHGNDAENASLEEEQVEQSDNDSGFVTPSDDDDNKWNQLECDSVEKRYEPSECDNINRAQGVEGTGILDGDGDASNFETRTTASDLDMDFQQQPAEIHPPANNVGVAINDDDELGVRLIQGEGQEASIENNLAEVHTTAGTITKDPDSPEPLGCGKWKQNHTDLCTVLEYHLHCMGLEYAINQWGLLGTDQWQNVATLRWHRY
ncbi:hypothetical protein BDQ17DRAFT_1323280 [Cyathus striatus]|nr:hypothetical protein BDQ17DRAFT_1323280 [Cyathus striatus]